MHGLLDPASSLAGVPDSFSCPTVKVTQRNLVTLGATASNSTLLVVYPGPLNYLGYGGKFFPVGTYQGASFRFTSPTNPTDAITPGVIVSNFAWQQRLLDSGKVPLPSNNVIAAGATWHMPAAPFQNVANPSVVPYAGIADLSKRYVSTAPSTGASTTDFSYFFDIEVTALLVYLPANLSLKFTYYDDNMVSLGSGSMVFGSFIGTHFYLQTSPAGLNAVLAMPATTYWIDFDLVNNLGAGNHIHVASIDCKIIVGTTIISERVIRSLMPGSWVSCPDIQDMSNDFHKIRTTAQSTLISYVGPTTAAGQLAAYVVLDGCSWADASSGIATFGTKNNLINSKQRSYTSPIQEGLYSVYRPQSLEMATRWGEILTPLDFDKPYLAVYITQTTSADVRVICTTNFEAQTESTLYNMTVTPSNYQQMFGALDALAHFPYVVSNPTHLDRILNVLKKTGKTIYDLRRPIAAGAGLIGNAFGQPEVGIIANAISNMMPDDLFDKKVKKITKAVKKTVIDENKKEAAQVARKITAANVKNRIKAAKANRR